MSCAFGLKLRIQLHVYKNELYMYIFHSPWTSKAKGAAVRIWDYCHYPQEPPLLRNPWPYICVYMCSVIYIKLHSQLWNQQQNKQTKTFNAEISEASLFFWGNIIEVLNNIWSLATLSTDVLLFTCLFHYATDGESCRWFFFLQIHKTSMDCNMTLKMSRKRKCLLRFYLR